MQIGPTRILNALHAVYVYKKVNLPASTRYAHRAEYTQIACSRMCVYLNIAGILQVILFAELIYASDDQVRG